MELCIASQLIHFQCEKVSLTKMYYLLWNINNSDCCDSCLPSQTNQGVKSAHKRLIKQYFSTSVSEALGIPVLLKTFKWF